MANILVGGVNLKTLGMHQGRAIATAYGAKANDSYDNAGVVQALVDAWEALDGGTIVFPASQEGARYRFTAGVTNDSINVVNFSGTGTGPVTYAAGGNQCVLWLDSDTDNAFLIKYAYTAAHTGGQIIERLNFMGNDDTDGLGVNQSGVVFAGRCNNHQIRECNFHVMSGYAIAHDPTVGSTYNQNSSIRNCHFWGVAGIFGPTQEYVAAAAYLFNTLYTFDNVGLDVGTGWTSWGHTPKPFLFDLRATRSAQFLGNLVIEGPNQTAGQTAVIALASDGDYAFGHIHYEITANDADYLFALYGVAGGYYNATGEKRLKIQHVSMAVGVPIWFEDAASNESVVEIDDLSSYNADAVGDLFEWENGIAVNVSGSVAINHLNTKYPVILPDNYYGRISIGAVGGDHPSRFYKPQKARRLFSWNPSMGSLIRNWGQVAITIESSSATTAIEADGNILCQRFTATVAATFPSLKFVMYGDNYEGAVVSLILRYRLTLDAADAGSYGRVTLSGISEGEFVNQVIFNGGHMENSGDYRTLVAGGIMLSADNDPNRFFFTQNSGTLTVAAIWRLAAVEVWLGTPDNYDLATVGVPVVPTFTDADATPSVAGFKTWKTFTAGLTITDLDDFPAGEERTIISKGAIVFDTTGTNLVGSSVDITTASGDITRWVSEDGTTKRLITFSDVSTDQSVDNT